MAKKPASSRARTAKPARRTSPKKPAAKKAAKKAAPKKATKTTRAAAKSPARKAAAKPKAPARTASAAAPRPHVVRRQPESLRLRDITPSFTVNDLQASMAFYVDALGFIVKDRWEVEGQLRGVMLVAGRCEIGLAQDDWAKGRDRVKGVGCRVYAETTQDLDALAERLRARGIAADGPHTSSWAARLLNLTDPDGFNLTLSNGQP